MKNSKLFWILNLLVVASLVLSACATPTPQAAQTTSEPVVVKETEIVVETQVVKETEIVEVEKVVTPTPGPNPEAVIEGVEEGAEITVWTFWLSPTFDDYIKSTIARFEQTYPGVKVNWEDHQGTFQDDLRNAFAAGNAPDVINLSVSEGWVSDYATQGKLMNLDAVVPQSVKDLYFPGLWNMQMVDGVNYQFPYYQGINVALVNRQLYDQTGLTLEEFPTSVDGLPALCQLIKEKTNTLCDIRLTVNDLLSQMVYEGNVQILNDEGTAFTFDSPEAVEWLQMYVDMVEAGTVDKTVLVTEQDRTGLDLFTSGKAAFYVTGPNLIREVRANNPALYGYLAAVPAPVGKSGVLGKGLMAMSVNAETQYPNAAVALAQFMTNPQSMVEFAKQVAVYPGTPASYDDPFFSAPSAAIEDSAKPIAKDIIAKYADIVPTVPNKADVNNILLQAVQAALFSGADPQTVLTDAVAQANELLNK